jgi:hypothetical protein
MNLNFNQSLVLVLLFTAGLVGIIGGAFDNATLVPKLAVDVRHPVSLGLSKVIDPEFPCRVSPCQWNYKNEEFGTTRPYLISAHTQLDNLDGVEWAASVVDQETGNEVSGFVLTASEKLNQLYTSVTFWRSDSPEPGVLDIPPTTRDDVFDIYDPEDPLPVEFLGQGDALRGFFGQQTILVLAALLTVDPTYNTVEARLEVAGLISEETDIGEANFDEAGQNPILIDLDERDDGVSGGGYGQTGGGGAPAGPPKKRDWWGDGKCTGLIFNTKTIKHCCKAHDNCICGYEPGKNTKQCNDDFSACMKAAKLFGPRRAWIMMGVRMFGPKVGSTKPPGATW